MTEVIVEKEVCSGCGVDVREDTLFCYNCGVRVGETARPDALSANNGVGDNQSAEAKAALLADSKEKLREGDSTEDKLALAAEKRRKARVTHRSARKIVWEPTGDSSQGLILLLAVSVAIITLVIVVLTVIWK